MDLTDENLIKHFGLKSNYDLKNLKKVRKAVHEILRLQKKYPKEDFFLFKDRNGNFKAVGDAKLIQRLMVDKWKMYGGVLDAK